MIPNSLITTASFTPNSLQSPNAWVGHMPFAAWVIQEIAPTIFVELGTHSGNSYFSFCQSVVEAGLSTKCYAVDTWQGDEHAGQYDEQIFGKVNAYHQEHYAGFSCLLRMTFDDAVNYFADESIELLHIDGLHTYEAVRHDFDTWLPKLAPGAVVMFHDTNVRERNFGVWKLWEELQASYPNNLEFVHSHGLGVLQLNNAPDDKKLEWLQPNSPEKQSLIKYFGALGSRQRERFELNELKQHAANLNQVVAGRDSQIASLDQAVAERDREITSLNQTVADRDSQIASLDQGVAECQAQITTLNQAVQDKDGQIANLNQALAERELRSTDRLAAMVSKLTQEMSERNGQITSLNQAVAERDNQITSLNQAVAECKGQIPILNQTVAEREGQIARLNQTVADHNLEIAALRSSNSWRVTKPLRLTSLLLRGKHKELLSLGSIKLKQSVTVEEPTGDQKSIQSLFGLPNGFDRDVYLKLNPDLAKAGVNPTTHYLLHGHKEGRMFSAPEIHIRAAHDFNADLDTILVVSHEASRSGAPVLSLNLVQAFVESYNVVVLLLKGGPLSDAFQLAGAAVMTSSNLRGNPILVQLIVGQLCERFNFKFALVNSIESRAVLPALGEHFVPAISLIHEFASCYNRPQEVFSEACFWSGEMVFSANVTMQNALDKYPYLGERFAHVLPQGRCLVPLEEFGEEQLQAERERISRLIRPKDIAENSVVILGAGFVQLRKGVDLFIECAARVLRAAEEDRYRFVWIGKGFEPENDPGYSVYLADQIRRAGLEKHVFFVDETAAIETAYEEADLLLLSSRLDPLPNVAIDAMAHGVPVLCFNKTTGIADFLIESGLQDQCVAEYLDSVDMAEKILALADSQDLYEYVANRCREASMAYFNMKHYVAKLEVLAQGACDRTKQKMMNS